MDYTRLQYRRQFLLTNSSVVPFENWKYEEISAGGELFRLVYHGDLESAHSRKNLEVYMVGYMLDPFSVTASNQDIIEELAGYGNHSDIVKRLNALNGKYVLLILEEDNLIFLNDATASKQVFYHLENNDIWIASTPNLISEYTTLGENENSQLKAYLNSDDYTNKNRAWFGSETPYNNLRILPPNHFIDIKKRKTERFWPSETPEIKSVNESIDLVAAIMRGTIESAASRYRLHISITGGWDTRMILSSSRNICNDAEYYTIKLPGNYEKNIWDYLVPQKISETYHLKYHVVEAEQSTPDEEYIRIYRNNSIFNRNVFAEVYYQYLTTGYEDRMNVTGSLGDQLLRAFYRFSGDTVAEMIARRFGVSGYPFIISSIDEWLRMIKPLADEIGIHIIDWFNWEYFSGNWGGVSATEHDIAREELRVFNCRDLFTTFMFIPEKLRYRDNPRAHRMVIERNWPELLNIRVEPSGIQYRKLKKVLRIIHMERAAEKVYTKLKS